MKRFPIIILIYNFKICCKNNLFIFKGNQETKLKKLYDTEDKMEFREYTFLKGIIS